MNEKININVSEKTQTLEIREGQAAKLVEFVPINIRGNIDTPLRYLEKRKGIVVFNNTHLEIDREKMNMVLVINGSYNVHDTVTGFLSMSRDFLDFKINTGESWSHRELSQFIKMHRSCFESKDTAIKLSDQLRDLKVKVEQDNVNRNDNRGNVHVQRLQKIKELNIPESFTLNLEIFKGTGKKQVQVEIYIDPDDFSCQLVSPDAADVIRIIRDNIIDENKMAIVDICPELVIIEQ